jgi:hypothetical protein
MIGLLCFVLAVLAAPIKSKMRLEAENAVLRHQLTVLRRRLQGRVRLTNKDRRLLIVLYRWFPSILQVLTIIRPETLIHWHRCGFAAIGAGSRDLWEAGRRSRVGCVTTTSERIDHWIKMRRSLVQFSGPGASNRSPS